MFCINNGMLPGKYPFIWLLPLPSKLPCVFDAQVSRFLPRSSSILGMGKVMLVKGFTVPLQCFGNPRDKRQCVWVKWVWKLAFCTDYLLATACAEACSPFLLLSHLLWHKAQIDSALRTYRELLGDLAFSIPPECQEPCSKLLKITRCLSDPNAFISGTVVCSELCDVLGVLYSALAHFPGDFPWTSKKKIWPIAVWKLKFYSLT